MSIAEKILSLINWTTFLISSGFAVGIGFACAWIIAGLGTNHIERRKKNGHYIKTNIDNALYLYDSSFGFAIPSKVKRVLARLAMHRRSDVFIFSNSINGRNVGSGV